MFNTEKEAWGSYSTKGKIQFCRNSEADSNDWADVRNEQRTFRDELTLLKVAW